MRKSLFIQSHGILSQDDKTLLYTNKDEKTAIPISQIQDIHAFGKVSLKSGAIGLLAHHGIPIHFYNMFQSHVSSLLPRSGNTNGTVIVAQTKAYLDKEKRASIAQEIVKASRHNMVFLLQNYSDKGDGRIPEIIEDMNQVDVAFTAIPRIMAAEAQIWKFYYSCFDTICPLLPFERRSFRPAHNEMNSLISLLNMACYTTTLTQILQTYLHPSISYLHEPLERRYSLSLDLAEHFKPILAHRVIFRLVNRRQITSESFSNEHGIRLTEPAFKLVLGEFQKQLDTTIQVPRLKRKMSYRGLIKQDVYKLVKFVLNDAPFKAFRAG